MAKFKRVKRGEAEIPTASLPDIVFLLMIFFLISTSMNPDKGLGLTLPPPGEQVKVAQENILNIYINAAGRVLLKDKEVNVPEISRIIKEELEKNPKLIVSLKTDLDAKYEDMIKVLDQLKLADAPRISLAAPEF